MEEALKALQTDVATCHALENRLKGKPACGNGSKANARLSKTTKKDASEFTNIRSVEDVLTSCITACKESRKRHLDESGPNDDLSDASLSQYTRFTDEIALDVYKQFLHYVPRLVNVVTLAEALPMPNSGITLPLDLANIAARCKGSFYAPRRFAAVQLAYSSPRCRVLVFHTGRLVGTGTGSAAAARLAISRAQLQLAQEANVHLHVRNFAVINQVGAVSLRATLNCDAFATDHSGESHFDRLSFVGLAWRPPRERICCEIYSTGRANLPGSTTNRQLLESFSRMLPELLRYSSASELLAKIPEEMQEHHRVKKQAQLVQPPPTAVSRKLGRAGQHLVSQRQIPVQRKAGLWDGWEDVDTTSAGPSNEPDLNGDLDLDALGL